MKTLLFLCDFFSSFDLYFSNDEGVVEVSSNVLWCSFIVAMSGMSFSAYTYLYSLCNSTIILGRKSPICVDDVYIGNFLASGYAVKKKCKELFHNSMIGSTLKCISSGVYRGYQLSIEAFMNFVLTTPRYLSIIKEYAVRTKDICLELILNCDALPVAGGHAWIFSMSLGNFGRLCKSVYGRFIGNVSNLNDKNSFHDLMKVMWDDNLLFISKLALSNVFMCEGTPLPVRIVMGGDDANNRNLKGLNSNGSKYFCSCCYDLKGEWSQNKGNHVLRTEKVAIEKFYLNDTTNTSQLNLPMIPYDLVFF